MIMTELPLGEVCSPRVDLVERYAHDLALGLKGMLCGHGMPVVSQNSASFSGHFVRFMTFSLVESGYPT